MKIFSALPALLAFAIPAVALAQEPQRWLVDAPDQVSPWKSSVDTADPLRGSLEMPPASKAPFGEAGLSLLQEDIAPDLHFGLSFYARLDLPGDTSVDSFDNVAYSDIFDVGYGVNVEASLMSRISPHWSMGGYLSLGWDQFSGSSNVDMGTGEFFSFDNQDTVTAILGGKVVHRFAPAWFWEGRMGVGMIHYGQLTFTDVTNPVAVSGLQFFKPVTHGLFDLGGRVGVGNSRVTFDFGIDFRFMGSEARGRDVTNVVDPDWFFVFSLDLGLSLMF